MLDWITLYTVEGCRFVRLVDDADRNQEDTGIDSGVFI